MTFYSSASLFPHMQTFGFHDEAHLYNLFILLFQTNLLSKCKNGLLYIYKEPKMIGSPMAVNERPLDSVIDVCRGPKCPRTAMSAKKKK